MRDYLYAPEKPDAVLDRLASPDTRLVTLTVTGDGYNLDENGDFRRSEPAVLRDVRSGSFPRRGSGTSWGHSPSASRRPGGFTVLSCDNLAEQWCHGRGGRGVFARLCDETLALWIERNVTFPDSMVDRITPQPGEDADPELLEGFGIRDRAPVATEPFTQWVIEDDFCNGRPPLEDVGAQFVTDVTPYKLAKTRLLNGTHTAMAYLGQLAGHRTTAEMVADPTCGRFLARLMQDEVAPLLPQAPGLDLRSTRRRCSPGSPTNASVIRCRGSPGAAPPRCRRTCCHRSSRPVGQDVRCRS